MGGIFHTIKFICKLATYIDYYDVRHGGDMKLFEDRVDTIDKFSYK
jgi:hypothetical protein